MKMKMRMKMKMKMDVLGCGCMNATKSIVSAGSLVVYSVDLGVVLGHHQRLLHSHASTSSSRRQP